MQYLISALEGIITFVSPCLLPMLPVYLTYFAGSDRSRGKTMVNALGFVLGFTVVFVLMGALAGTLGGLLRRYSVWVDIVTGAAVIFFGLCYTGVIRLKLFNGSAAAGRIGGFFSAILFGIIFSVGWTPCVGAFLGSALMLASQQGSALQGIAMLLSYSAGLAVPFLLSALLIDRLKSAFDLIKRHYGVIRLVCGVFLIIIGLLMATGLMNKLLGALSA